MKNIGRTLDMVRRQGAIRVRFKDGEISEVEFPPPVPEVSAVAASPQPERFEPPPEEPKRSDLDALNDLPEYTA